MSPIYDNQNIEHRVSSCNVLDPQLAVNMEFGRLVHAAIINRRFRESLLSNPARVVDDGYCGESFHFSSDVKERIGKIRACSLEDFSSQLMRITTSTVIREVAIAQY
jgi:hypothetical protein